MVAAEKIPLKKLEYKAEGIQTQISTYGEIKSLTSKLGDIVSKLTRDSAWNGVSISSSNTTLSGTMTGIAATGTYNIKVTDLAQAQTTALGGTDGAALPKDQAMGAGGTIKLTMGTESKSIAIASSDTLTKIATKINEAGMGIQASIVTNVDGQERLMLRSKETSTPKATYGELRACSAGAENHPRCPKCQGGAEWFGRRIQQQYLCQHHPWYVVYRLGSSHQHGGHAECESRHRGDEEKYARVCRGLQRTQQPADPIDQVRRREQTAGVLQGDSATVSLQNSLRMLTRRRAAPGG